MKDLSICIVGKDKETFLKRCIESCLLLSDHISYIDLGSEDNSMEIAEAGGVFVMNHNPLKNVPQNLREFHKSEWTLFLKPDEKIICESDTPIIQTLNESKAMGFSLIVKTPLSPEVLEDYRWIKIPGKRNHYLPESVIVPKIEIRLVRKQYFVKTFNLMISQSSDRIFSFSSQIFKAFQIHSLQYSETTPEESDPNRNKDMEMKYLRGEVSIDPEEDYGMWELGDGFIGYNVLNRDDLARYYRGLAMGFGSERMYLSMLHNLGKFGRFSEAKDFFDAWHEKWGSFDTPEPYKIGGIIYANLFQLEEAVTLFEKYLERASEKFPGEAISLLAKALLLLGKKDDARRYLKQSLGRIHDKFDSTLLAAIEDDNWTLPKLSVCMIARDESANMAKALESLSGIADEIIVVDTGSKDETKDIARNFNAKIIDIEWENDFSKARNAGLRSATGDYILCLDADEYIDPRERIKFALFKMLLPTSRDMAFCTKIDTEDEDEEMSVLLRLPKLFQPDYPIRIFPAQKEIFFEGSAFESVDKSIMDLGITIKVNEVFKITHIGSDRKWREVRKGPAIQKVYESHPDPETALKAALYNLRLGNINATSKWLEMAQFNNPRLWMKIIILYCRLGQTQNVVGIIRKALKECPDSLELSLAKAELHFAEDEYETVCGILDPAMENIEKEMAREDRANAAYLYGMALLETGSIENGIELLSDARELDSWNMRYKIGGIYALTIVEEWEKAIHALSDVLMEEKISIIDTIHDFSDVAIVFTKLGCHFESEERLEASKICNKIVLNIMRDKMSSPVIREKMINYLDMRDTRKEYI